MDNNPRRTRQWTRQIPNDGDDEDARADIPVPDAHNAEPPRQLARIPQRPPIINNDRQRAGAADNEGEGDDEQGNM